ncbi:MAG: dephospho-CoA kinase [Flavobacteriales bacterium]|jgi:dephospho-CoA kinase|nr:dephospho-CoA kinase [Flavobacteriales bacterium]
MIIVGLTGGIGSGKTTVAKLFESLGIPVFYADDEAKKLMQTSEILKSKISATFGDKAYLNNTLNRAYLADLVFTDKANLNRLNALVHPEVKRHFINWVSQQSTPYVIYENAILFETNSASQFDFIITVTANIETRIDRIINRDNVARQMVLDRINNQWKDEDKIKLSDAVIVNENTVNLNIVVKNLHKKILSLSV